MASNSNTLPQGFSVFQPALGAQLQFFPALGTRELDELVNAYIPGPASVQEKRTSISLDYFEYAHLTGQTFKFYPVYTLSATVESPATASPLQDSGYGSSFNTSPVMSNWDWSHVNTTTSSRRSSPKSTSSHQPADFSNLPGMKIMTKDGRDVTNSASRGSKTKEQRDHAHLMRIIKACESCKKKKIRCDPSHKKRGVSSTSAQPAKVTKKTKTTALEAKIAPMVVQDTFAPQIALSEQDLLVDLVNFAASGELGNESWEQFVQFPALDDSYDFFNDPEGYLSPQSSSTLSEYSTKPASPATEADLRRRRGATADVEIAGPADPTAYLPFNQVEVNHDYVDFNLYSPESSFSEDERMVPIEVSKQSVSQPRSPAPNPLPPNESSNGLNSHGSELTGDQLEAHLAAASLAPQQLLFTHGQLDRDIVNRDPGAGLEYYSSPPTSSLDSDLLSTSAGSQRDSSTFVSNLQSSVDASESTRSNVTISRDIIEAHGLTTVQPDSRPTETGTTQVPAQTGSQSTEIAGADSQHRSTEIQATTSSPGCQNVGALDEQQLQDSPDAEIHNVAGDISQRSPTAVLLAPVAMSLALMYRQPSMAVLMPIAALLIAFTIWSCVSKYFVHPDKSFEQRTPSLAPTKRKSNGLLPRTWQNVSGLQSTTLSYKKPVDRMILLSRSLIAV
ncbi:uncharacterized protein FTOL_08255 [Fusarium torulosum]|uniref:Uncharacterized protein n=1 Tax=Fusarium torulosum TaxID=33205 RepID=A0AAE8MCD9_9HYPO|nr:uncharacterized protein FTOL_08255 [Fusarium torulosum]